MLSVIAGTSRQACIKTCFAEKSAHKVRVNCFPNRKPAGKVLNSPCLVTGQRTKSFRKEATYRVWTLTPNSVPDYTIFTWEEPTTRQQCKKAEPFQKLPKLSLLGIMGRVAQESNHLWSLSSFHFIKLHPWNVILNIVLSHLGVINIQINASNQGFAPA